jgi:hypothetical protein
VAAVGVVHVASRVSPKITPPSAARSAASTQSFRADPKRKEDAPPKTGAVRVVISGKSAPASPEDEAGAALSDSAAKPPAPSVYTLAGRPGL